MPRCTQQLLTALGVALLAAACGSSDVTPPVTGADQLTFTGASINSLDSTVQVIVNANPGDPTLKSLADSTLLVLSAGVQAQRVNISTNLTSAPLYFVGIHRTINGTTNVYSTWTVVGIDDPSHLAAIVEIAGFAASPSGPAPVSLTAAIGSGAVNGRMFQVGNGGAVSQWIGNSGSATFLSDGATTSCPGFVPPSSKITCALERMHVKFTMSATGSSTKTATQTDLVDIPAMRLTYTP